MYNQETGVRDCVRPERKIDSTFFSILERNGDAQRKLMCDMREELTSKMDLQQQNFNFEMDWQQKKMKEIQDKLTYKMGLHQKQICEVHEELKHTFVTIREEIAVKMNQQQKTDV